MSWENWGVSHRDEKINDLFLAGLSCRHVGHRTGFSAVATSAYQGLLCSAETFEIF